jgi:hypothetical protein
VLIRERDGDSEELPILRVRGDNPDWQPYPKQDIRLHLDTHDVIEDGDIVTVTMLDSGASKLVPGRAQRHRRGPDGLVADPVHPRHQRAGHDLRALRHPAPGGPERLRRRRRSRARRTRSRSSRSPSRSRASRPVRSCGSTWATSATTGWSTTAGPPGPPRSTARSGTVEFWEYEEIERFQTVWEPFLVFTHTEATPSLASWSCPGPASTAATRPCTARTPPTTPTSSGTTRAGPTTPRSRSVRPTAHDHPRARRRRRAGRGRRLPRGDRHLHRRGRCPRRGRGAPVLGGAG